MKPTTKRQMLWAALALSAFGGAFGVAVFDRGSGAAATLPGLIAQTGSSSSQSISVSVDGAIFSGTAIDVDLSVRPDDATVAGAGVVPAAATLAGADGLTASASAGGRTVLRFPGEAWPTSGTTATLSIQAVDVRQASGQISRVEGHWELTIVLPQGDAAAKARAVEALPAAHAEIAGEDVQAQAFRSQSATLVRYELPAALLSLKPPSIKSTSGTLQAVRVAQREAGLAEAWFDATPGDGPLTLVFDSLLAPDPNGGSWRLDLALDAFDPPSGTPQQRNVGWRVQPASDGPEVKEIMWERRVRGDIQLSVTVAGLWDPGAGGLPEVLGDGTAVTVADVGLRPATSARDAQTIVTLALSGPDVPRQLTILAAGKSVPVASASVALRP